MKTIIKSMLVLLIFSTSAFASEKAAWGNDKGNDLLSQCSVAVDFLDKKDLSRDQAFDALQCLHYISQAEVLGSQEKAANAACAKCWSEPSKTL
jgi:hypothetical protein